MSAGDRSEHPSDTASVPGLPALPVHALLGSALQHEHGDVQRDALRIPESLDMDNSTKTRFINCGCSDLHSNYTF